MSDATTLFSGGTEGVLVVWHNIGRATGSAGGMGGTNKSFLPRLGAPISFVSNSSADR